MDIIIITIILYCFNANHELMKCITADLLKLQSVLWKTESNNSKVIIQYSEPKTVVQQGSTFLGGRPHENGGGRGTILTRLKYELNEAFKQSAGVVYLLFTLLHTSCFSFLFILKFFFLFNGIQQGVRAPWSYFNDQRPRSTLI